VPYLQGRPAGSAARKLIGRREKSDVIEKINGSKSIRPAFKAGGSVIPDSDEI
jgi:hypothetical protein